MSFARQRNSAFRAPPPSPIATAQGIKSAAVNDEILSEFLEHSLRIPDLVLPEPLIRTDIPDLNLPAFDLLSDDPKQSGVKRLVQSAIEFGCFQVINHGISSELLEEAEKECIRLFALPLETKQMVCRSDESNFGFEDIGNDSANSKMRHETFWMDRNADLIEETMRTIWPQGYKNFRPDSLLVTMWNILKAKVQSEFRIYADHGWITVNLKPGSLLVTVGNILKVWSNGQLKHVIGRPIACGDKHFISMEFVYLPPVPTSRSEGIERINVSLVDQLLLVIALVFLWHFFVQYYLRA